MTMNNFNIRALILAREVRGLSQRGLAELLPGIHQNYLSKVETGEIQPSDEAIEKIADTLKFPKDFFAHDVNKTAPIIDFFYRKRVALPAKVKAKIEAEVDLIRYIYDRLLETVDVPETRIPSVSLGSGFTPEDAAALAREYYAIPPGPVRNLVKVLESNGIAVIFIDIDTDKFDGLTVYTDKGHPIIVINSRIPNDRKKHTICHELGHQICHLPFRFDFALYDRIKEDEKALDKEADQFAAAFLMPEKEIRPMLYGLTYGKLPQLKLYWQVSKKSLIFRAKYLDCINEDKYRFLLIELSRHGERTSEQLTVELDEPQILKEVFNYFKTDLQYDNNDFTKYLRLYERDWLPLSGNNSKMRIVLK